LIFAVESSAVVTAFVAIIEGKPNLTPWLSTFFCVFGVRKRWLRR
jgi:hypothetical protein